MDRLIATNWERTELPISCIAGYPAIQNNSFLRLLFTGPIAPTPAAPYSLPIRWGNGAAGVGPGYGAAHPGQTIGRIGTKGMKRSPRIVFAESDLFVARCPKV